MTWIQLQRIHLEAAIEGAQQLGMAAGSTTEAVLGKRVVDGMASKGLTEVGQAEGYWDWLTKESSPGGNRLTDLAWWTGCEESDDEVRNVLVKQSQEAFILHYRSEVHSFIRQRFRRGDPNFADDITNTAFVNVIVYYWSAEAKSKFRGEKRTLYFLQSIARNAANAHLKKDDKHSHLQYEDLLNAPATEEDQTDLELEQKRRGAVDACLEELPPKCRVVAYRHWKKNRTTTEIAHSMNVKLPAISNQIRRAIEHLTKCVARKGFEVSLGPTA